MEASTAAILIRNVADVMALVLENRTLFMENRSLLERSLEQGGRLEKRMEQLEEWIRTGGLGEGGEGWCLIAHAEKQHNFHATNKQTT